MKRFAFRLQKLLDWRRQRKEAQSAVVARALAGLNREQRDLDALGGQHRIVQDGLRRQRAGLLDAQQVIRTEAFEVWLRDQLDAQRQRVAMASDALARERHMLSTLARDEKVLGQLRDRRVQEHRLESLRLEGQQLDDMASVRHQRERTQELARG